MPLVLAKTSDTIKLRDMPIGSLAVLEQRGMYEDHTAANGDIIYRADANTFVTLNRATAWMKNCAGMDFTVRPIPANTKLDFTVS